QTTIAGLTFTWTQGLVLDRAMITGKDLINKYQVSYGQGYLLGDGVNEGLTSQSLNYNMWVKTVTLGSYLTRSDGSSLFSGSYVLSNALLLGDGVAIGDGFAIGDCSLGDTGPGMK